MLTHKRQLLDLHRVLAVYTLIFLVWGVYRLTLPLPVAIEEVFVKGLVFGVPVFYVILVKEKQSLESLGMTTKGLVKALYFGVGFGVSLALMANLMVLVRGGVFDLIPRVGGKEFGDLMILGLVTAFWEQLVFAGYMLPRVVKDLNSELVGLGLVALMFSLIHLPVQLAASVAFQDVLVRLFLLFTLGFGSGLLYLRFKNLAAPIFAHLAWGGVIFLFG